MRIVIFLAASELLVFVANSQTLDSLRLDIGVTTAGWSPQTHTAIPLPDGKTLVGGFSVVYMGGENQSYTNLVRLNSDGSVDNSFSEHRWTGSGIACVALQTNGLILAGGTFSAINGQGHPNLVRFCPDGTVDPQFNAGNIDDGVSCVLPQPDGKIVICGWFKRVNSKSCIGLCRLNYDGSLDTNFNANANNSVGAIALQPDGKIIALGAFTEIGGQACKALARLNPDGSIDPSFLPVVFKFGKGAGVFGAGGAVALQSDGKILVGGLFDKVNDQSHTNLVRLNPDGALDSVFNAQADFRNCWGVQTFSLQTDGKILVGHDSGTMNGSPCAYFSRLDPDGRLDPTFSTNVIRAGVMLFSCALQSDGGILAGGWFHVICGAIQSQVARLLNTEPATQSLDYDGTNIVWLRGGTSPEVWRTSFEAATNGTDWACIGEGRRIPGGWQMADVLLSTNATIRARGFLSSGRSCGSSWFVEAVWPRISPSILANDATFGFRGGRFRFNLSGSAGSRVIIDSCDIPFDWTPISTNMLVSGPTYFGDPTSSNSPCRLYRARLQ